MRISPILLDWYKQNKRDLPWRNTTDAYAIWVSEIILQQTRVAQGIDYYRRFLEAFPTVTDLAQASQTDVLRLWQGLGYYSRARNMHKAAQIVASQHQGIFPTEYTQLLTLPGIGSYTAAAIASFASNAPHAVIDGNVYRVLSRLFGIETPIDSTEGKKLFAELAQDQLDKKNAAAYNQAIMDFGATHCTPTSPACLICPFVEQCEAARNHKTDLLPVKLGKTKQRERYFWYFDIWKDNTTYLQQRTAKDIWQGLYEPYLIEGDYDETSICQHPFIQQINATIIGISPAYKHVLSHQTIIAHFVRLAVTTDHAFPDGLVKINGTEIENYPVPQLIVRYRRLNKQ